jgi:hypothetical protein
MIRMLLPLILLTALAACGSDNNNVLAPQYEPEVVNIQDSFSFQATDIADITQQFSYRWENSGNSANLDQSCSLDQGTASVRVMDALGYTVYTGDLSADGSFQSGDGAAGTWRIIVNLSGTSGTLNFSLQKRTP